MDRMTPGRSQDDARIQMGRFNSWLRADEGEDNCFGSSLFSFRATLNRKGASEAGNERIKSSGIWIGDVAA